jgi:hypothetical protein
VLALIKKLFIVCLTFAALDVLGSEVINTKWELKEEYLDLSQKLESEDKHSIKMGYGRKHISNLQMDSAATKFDLGAQSVPGAQVDYQYNLLSSPALALSLYSNFGFYTKYNDLNEMGHADLSIFDMFFGASVGRNVFSLEGVKVKAFAGAGHGYYYQRGDVDETNADRSGGEAEYGLGLDWLISSSDAFPDSWASEYVLGVKFSRFNSLDEKNGLEGNKIGAVFGVRL